MAHTYDWKDQLVQVKAEMTLPKYFKFNRWLSDVLKEWLIDDLKKRESKALKVVREAKSQKFGELSNSQLRCYEELIHCKYMIRQLRARQHGLSGNESQPSGS